MQLNDFPTEVLCQINQVKVRLVQEEIPAGVEKLLSILEDQITAPIFSSTTKLKRIKNEKL